MNGPSPTGSVCVPDRRSWPRGLQRSGAGVPTPERSQVPAAVAPRFSDLLGIGPNPTGTLGANSSDSLIGTISRGQFQGEGIPDRLKVPHRPRLLDQAFEGRQE